MTQTPAPSCHNPKLRQSIIRMYREFTISYELAILVLTQDCGLRKPEAEMDLLLS